MRVYRHTNKQRKLLNVHRLAQIVLADGQVARAYEAHTSHRAASINQEDLAAAVALKATHALLKTGDGNFLCTVEELQKELSKVKLTARANRPSLNYWAVPCLEAWRAEVDPQLVSAECCSELEAVTFRPEEPERPYDEIVADGLLPKDFYNPTAARLLSRRPKDLASVKLNLWEGTITIERRKR